MSESQSSLPDELAKRADLYRDELQAHNLPEDVAVEIDEKSIKVGPDYTVGNRKAIGVQVRNQRQLVSAVQGILTSLASGTQYEFVRINRTNKTPDQKGHFIFHEQKIDE